MVTDCAGIGNYSDGNWHRPEDVNGLYEQSWACSGMVISRVKITIDKICKPGTAWPAEKDWAKSCGGYTAINASYGSHAMLAGVVSAVRIVGQDAVLQDSEIVHYGTCGSNVAFALEVNSARNVLVRRNTILYGCTAYGFGSTDGLTFEHNALIPYKNASGGGSNVQVFGARQQMRRLWYANNTQLLCDNSDGRFCPPGHLETMTTDGGAGFYEGPATVANDDVTLTTGTRGKYNQDATGKHRAEWRIGAVLLLSGPGAGQWRQAQLQGETNNTWVLDSPFEAGREPTARTFAVITKMLGQLLFVGNRWGHSHVQLYAECLDCVVAENVFEDSFAASWGMNPHNLIGGWQPNFQTEWLRNTVSGGTGITLMTSDQLKDVRSGVVNSSYAGPLDNRIVLRGNTFRGGGGVQLGTVTSSRSPGFATISSAGNVLIDSNILAGGACNLTLHPMPTGGDINRYERCGANCSLSDVVFHGNNLVAVNGACHM